MVTSFSRGHKIYYDSTSKIWRYKDNNDPISVVRTCYKCGKPPTKEGYDACIGYVPGATSVCCGHGVDRPILKFD